jgi:hypothetical protein
MPVIVDPDGCDLWLDPGMTDVGAAFELLKSRLSCSVISEGSEVASERSIPEQDGNGSDYIARLTRGVCEILVGCRKAGESYDMREKFCIFFVSRNSELREIQVTRRGGVKELSGSLIDNNNLARAFMACQDLN